MPLPGECADLAEQRVAAPLFRHQAELGELAAHALGVRVRLVDLVDRDDDRHLGRVRVSHRFLGLRHHAVVGGDHQHDDVGGLRAARAHRGERLVARRVEEGDRAARRVHRVGADVLRDAAGLAGDDVGLADAVEQAGLAVVDVAHDGHDRRPADACRRVDFGFDALRGDDRVLLADRDVLDLPAELVGDDLRRCRRRACC